MRRILGPRPPRRTSITPKAPAPAVSRVGVNSLEFKLKQRIYSLAAEKAAADGVICGYEEPTVLQEARQKVLQEAVVKATTFEELKAIVTMMLDSNDGLVEGLADIQRQLAKSETDGVYPGE